MEVRMDPIKVFGVWAVGLAVLLGTTGGSLARPKQVGQTWCVCTCDTQPGPGCGNCTVLSWEKTYHCAANGRNCTGDRKPGRLTNCNQCVVQDNLAFGQCEAQPTVAPPRPRPPKVPPTGPRNPPSSTKG